MICLHNHRLAIVGNRCFSEFYPRNSTQAIIRFYSVKGDDIIDEGPPSLRLVHRDEWLAQPPSNVLTDLEVPATRIIIAHTATENCSTQVILAEPVCVEAENNMRCIYF